MHSRDCLPRHFYVFCFFCCMATARNYECLFPNEGDPAEFFCFSVLLPMQKYPFTPRECQQPSAYTDYLHARKLLVQAGPTLVT